MKHYQSLEQRITASYIDTFPPFFPSDDFSSHSQFELYSLVRSAYQSILADPSIFFSLLHDDDAFNNRFNKSSDNKPDLLKNMRKASKEIEDFFGFLVDLGSVIENRAASPRFRIPAKYSRLLSVLGIDVVVGPEAVRLRSDNHSNLEQALIWMARKNTTSSFIASRCIFSPEHYSLSENYRALSGSEAEYNKLIEYLERSKYHIVRTPNSTALEYLKGKGGSLPEHGGFQYKVNHIGISMFYDELVKKPASYSICIPSMATLLKFFKEMDEDLKKFVVMTTKKCDNCRYCVQTDKSGKRHLAFINVEYQEDQYSLCPYFPGYCYTFEHLDEFIVEHMIKLLSFMEERLDFLVK